jgi:murein DD-endopeptidase MepM/ murein hydrolase activator NlpD
MSASPLARALAAGRAHAASVIPFDLSAGGLCIFDFTAANADLVHLDINDVSGFTDYLFARIAAAEMPVGVGRYDEDRVVYRHSPLFDGEAERRSVHLGLDLFVVEGTEVRAPFAATVQSLADNAGLGDYGPTVILEHLLEELPFYTLYGHLSQDTLSGLAVGRQLAAGQAFGSIGDVHENGGWPPHLHFQLIADLLGHSGDFPGVAAPSERERYLALCPDPNLVLQVPGL